MDILDALVGDPYKRPACKRVRNHPPRYYWKLATFTTAALLAMGPLHAGCDAYLDEANKDTYHNTTDVQRTPDYYADVKTNPHEPKPEDIATGKVEPAAAPAPAPAGGGGSGGTGGGGGAAPAGGGGGGGDAAMTAIDEAESVLHPMPDRPPIGLYPNMPWNR